MLKPILKFLGLVITVIIVACQPTVAPPKPHGPLPSAKQLEWHELEFYAFVHFTTNTFTDREWGFGDESPELFNPTELDTRQWARIAKEAGMKGIILTAKHHDGFCLWPSKYTDHSVENSPWKDGKGDVVQELADACREYGLKLGLYLSPWDRNHPEYGKEEYVIYFRNQLKELLTNYGDVFEMWFDGANGGDGYYGGANETRKINTLEYYDWQTTYDSIYKWSPKTLVWGIGPSEARWIGNEEGYANSTNWSMLKQEELLKGNVHYTEFMSGHEDGERWVPGEADVSIRPGWFYHATQDNHVRSLGEVVDIYYKSIGRNANLLLNLPVDRRGLVHENDEARLMEMVEVIKSDFEKELLKDSKVTVDNIRGNSSIYSAENLIDGDKETYWTTDDSLKSASITFKFDEPRAVNRVLLQEHIKLGQRVREFNVEALVNGRWETIANETTIGYKRILRTTRVNAIALRINITDARACPILQTIQAFNAPTFVHGPKILRDKNGMVTIEALNPSEQLYYTLDGSEPTENSIPYTEPFPVNKSGSIKAISRNTKEGINSKPVHIWLGTSKHSWIATTTGKGKTTNLEKSIDDDLSTEIELAVPGQLVIDFNEVLEVDGFTYMPFNSGGKIRTYQLFTSLDGLVWTEQMKGEFSNIKHNPIVQEQLFKETTAARYLKLVAKEEVEGKRKVSIAEIGIIE